MSQLRSASNGISQQYYEKILKKVDKKFYIGMDFHKIFNPEYPNEYFTALFNEINNLIPSGTHLHNLDSLPKV
jgi:hypothetical protein